MKKDPNNSMNGTATMPSYFPCIKSSESHPLADWLYLKSVITSSISPLQRPHYFTSSYTYLFSKKVILLSFLG